MSAHTNGLKTLGIIPCSKEKIWDITPERKAVPAKEAYRSSFHRFARLYAEKYCDAHIIFSAKYGFMEPDFMIPGPYDVTFSRPEDSVITDKELQKQARNYATYTSIVIICPRTYAQKIDRAFSLFMIQREYPLQKVGGFGKMHRFLRKSLLY